MKKSYMDAPAIIQLEAVATGITLRALGDAISSPLLRDLREKLFEHGLNFSPLYYTQRGRFSDYPDFRCDLVLDLVPEPPWNCTNTCQIQRRLEIDADAFPDYVREARSRLTGADLQRLEKRLSELPANHARSKMPDATSTAGMYRYLWLELGKRVDQMLVRDLENGKLVVTAKGDGAFISLDNLIAWANGYRILVVQEARPGCVSLVADAYVRLHQALTTAIIATAESPNQSSGNRSLGQHRLPPTEVVKPIPRTAAQDSAIIAAILELNFDPKHLPAFEPGGTTIKSHLRTKLLKRKDIFQSTRVFDTAWQRLRDQGHIANTTAAPT